MNIRPGTGLTPGSNDELTPKDRIRQTVAIAFAGLTVYALFIKILFF